MAKFGVPVRRANAPFFAPSTEPLRKRRMHPFLLAGPSRSGGSPWPPNKTGSMPYTARPESPASLQIRRAPRFVRPSHDNTRSEQRQPPLASATALSMSAISAVRSVISSAQN